MLYVSPGYERVWGRSLDSLYQAPNSFTENIVPEDRPKAFAAFEKQRRLEPFDVYYHIQRPDGSVIKIRDRGFPVKDDDGAIRTFVGVARDVTAAGKHAEAERLEAIGRLTGSLVHDFSNLLSIIGINATLMSNSPSLSDPVLRDRLNTILMTIKRTEDITRSLLAAARRQVLEPTVVDITALLRENEALLRTSSGPGIVLRLPQIGPAATIRVDPGALLRAVLNLIVNAREAMSGNGTLAIATDLVRLSGNEPMLSGAKLPPGPYAALTVKDDGPGMSPEIAARAFEPFFTTKQSGSGIGLSMVHGFARQSGGTACIESAPGRGTCVRLYLPMDIASQAAKPVPVGGDTSGSSGRVLVVDDEPDLAAGVCDLLATSGYSVQQAASGTEALSVLERDRFDLLLTDVAMRGMTGPELAKTAAEIYPGLAILLITGNPDSAIGVTRWPVLDKGTINVTLPTLVGRTLAEQAQARAGTGAQ